MPDRILIVDDEEDIREIYSRSLERDGFLTDVAETAPKALELLSENSYQVVIADIRMPGMDGITLLGKVKALSPATDVIMATGYPATDTAVQALRLGAFDYITKPCTLDELSHTVKKALSAQKLSAENLLLKRMNAIYEVSSAFSGTLKLSALLQLILEKGTQAVSAQGAELLLGSPLEKKAEIHGGVSPDAPFVAEVVEKGEKRVVRRQNRELLGIPLISRGEKLGVLCMTRVEEPFSGEEQKLLQIFAEQAAAAIRDARINEALQEKVVELQNAYEKLKKAQEQLVRTEKLSALGELAAGVAHEINNPLATLLGYVQVLARNEQVEEKEKRYMQIMEQEIERMARIVTGLLNFAHQETPHHEALSLPSLIEETLLIAEHQIARYGDIRIVKNLSEVPAVSADRQQIQQVLVNLLLNAAQAMEGKGGELTISLEQAQRNGNSFAVLSVRDTGEGVPEEIRAKIFDPFFTTKDPGKGTGLGLSIAYGIVENHGGTITISSNQGEGTTFSVYLPIPKGE